MRSSPQASRGRCGPDVEEHVQKIKPFLDAGFTEVALVQIGADQQEPFFEWAQNELSPRCARCDREEADVPGVVTYP